MKALFLSHKPPFPEIGGDRRRIAQSLRLLTELYDVDIAYISNSKTAPEMRSFLQAIKTEKKFYASPVNKIFRAARTLVNGRSLVENLFFDSSLYEYVKSVASDYDLVFCASPVMATYAMKAGIEASVLDMTDSLTLNYENAAHKARGWRRYLYSIDARRMRRFESLCRRKFQAVAYISEIDRDYLGSQPLGLHIVHNAVPACPVLASAPLPSSPVIIFVGIMDYEPNVVAATFFARKVMPELKKRFDDIIFKIVGASPNAEVRSLSSIPGVEVTGRVDSVDPYYLNSTIVVAPMLSGSGVQNKILEALARGCKVITTPIGLEGIECLSDVLTVVPPDETMWVDAMAAAIAEASAGCSRNPIAPRRVEEEFGLDKIRAQFHEFLKIRQ